MSTSTNAQAFHTSTSICTSDDAPAQRAGRARRRRLSRPSLTSAIAGMAVAMLLGAPALTPALAQTDAPAFAANIIVPQSRVIVTPDTANPVRLQRVETTVDIRDQVATTSIRLILHNPSGRAQEAELVMPVPDGAAIRSFHLEALGDDGGARLLPRDEARRIYEAIVRRMVDPAILEFAGTGMIRSNVFPVPAGEESVLRLVYEQILPADGDRFDYVLPRSMQATDAEWSIKVNVESQREIASVYSPTHDLVVSDAGAVIPAGGGRATSRKSFEVQNAAAGGAFQLAVLQQPGDGLGATFITYPDPRVTDGTTTGGYFLMLAGVPQPDDDTPRIPRELTLVIDRSGSMRDGKLDQAREAAMQIISGLASNESFSIIVYSDQVETFSDGALVASRENVQRAMAYLGSIRASGGTNIHDALVEAVREPVAEGTLPIVLFLTDGLPTIGQTGERAIRTAVQGGNRHERRIFTFGVGYDVNTPLLRAIATDSRATSTFVQPGQDVEATVGQVYRRLRGPVFAGPEIGLAERAAGARGAAHGTARINELLPAALPDIFEGEQLIVLGTYIGESPMDIRISGNFLGEQRTFTATLDPAKASTRNAFVPRLWATRRIGALLEAIRQNPGSEGNQELVTEIVALSTEYGILTEYTAFLAAERDDIITAGGQPMPAAPLEAWSDARVQLRVVEESLRVRNDARAGREAMNQEMNAATRAEAATITAGANVYLAEDMARREIMTVLQVNERAYFQQGNRWVDSAMLAQAAEEPEVTVEFGTEAYSTLLDELIVDNRQAVLANRGEVYLLHRGRRVLVINPS